MIKPKEERHCYAFRIKCTPSTHHAVVASTSSISSLLTASSITKAYSAESNHPEKQEDQQKAA